ncbi:low molecular weight protein arginine phosphatase [Symbiobacterium thermophilum]|uniref:Low molecular weight protein-tyrosine-phosphatase n=2 Tax=Symbiobacterium thermophilum TaxID=2734 RepID=Q67TD2_SYMTH|nr:low molecular weight protein arginine phosphatase [Symbiobacterium thermophilum]MBY6277172.1 low molecular weight protein arginine phosphatase [Symbiobacterium thermophilum]BAD39061.1 low molecular weight protein-tyrosine-phosphatase [Symbiobacterium thermophilum IAM 14863]
MRVERVLLVCSGNTCRSPMAAALLRALWRRADPGWDLQVDSAGIGAFPGLPAAPNAVAAMKARGIDLSGHRSQAVTDLEGYDLVLGMTRAHRDALRTRFPALAGRIFTLAEYAGVGGDLSDPFGGPLQAYEETAKALEEQLQAVVERIRREGSAAQ